MKNKTLWLIFSVLFYTTAHADNFSTLVDTKEIERHTAEIFYDDSIRIDIDGDGKLDSTLHFSYSRIGPSSSCENLDSCNINTGSVITSYIETPHKKIQINYMCKSIGIYSTKSKNYRDIFCGPDLNLHWDGENYIESSK